MLIIYGRSVWLPFDLRVQASGLRCRIYHGQQKIKMALGMRVLELTRSRLLTALNLLHKVRSTPRRYGESLGKSWTLAATAVSAMVSVAVMQMLWPGRGIYHGRRHG